MNDTIAERARLRLEEKANRTPKFKKTEKRIIKPLAVPASAPAKIAGESAEMKNGFVEMTNGTEEIINGSDEMTEAPIKMKNGSEETTNDPVEMKNGSVKTTNGSAKMADDNSNT
jgi:hypothetical protein